MKKKFALLVLLLGCLTSGACAAEPRRGYRGFAEWSNDLRFPNYWNIGRETNYYTGFSTSHGFQFNPHFFLGAGLAFEKCSDEDSWLVPFFVQARTDQKFGKFTPFADVRLGYDAGRRAGVYFSPSIGYRFNFGHKVGLNISIGYTLSSYKIDLYQVDVEEDHESGNIFVDVTKLGETRTTNSMLSLRLGIDF